MTSRQKRVIAALIITNAAVIVALVVLVIRPGKRFSFPVSTSSPIPSDTPTASSLGDCQWKATQLLTQAGLGGTTTLTSGRSLQFEVVYPLAPSQSVDEAAQQVWTVFDIVLALVEDQCNVFSHVDVVIVVQDGHDDTRISASVDLMNLEAFDAGELGEEEFIERVAYTISLVESQ